MSAVRDETSKLIKDNFAVRAYGEHQRWNHSQIKEIKEKDKQTTYALRSGYIQHVDYNYLIKWANKNKMVLEANFQVGDYVPNGSPYFIIGRLTTK
nr:DUF2254 family protein [Oceanobacillus kimchii]